MDDLVKSVGKKLSKAVGKVSAAGVLGLGTWYLSSKGRRNFFQLDIENQKKGNIVRKDKNGTLNIWDKKGNKILEVTRSQRIKDRVVGVFQTISAGIAGAFTIELSRKGSKELVESSAQLIKLAKNAIKHQG